MGPNSPLSHTAPSAYHNVSAPTHPTPQLSSSASGWYLEPDFRTDTHSGMVAVYSDPGLPPAVITVDYSDPSSFIRELVDLSFACATDVAHGDSPIPVQVYAELIGNLIHAGFADPVVSILDSGCQLRVSDCGPGIQNKPHALEAGYTSATQQHRKYIRGVGSGLHLAHSILNSLGGSLTITDNVGGGTVVTASVVGGDQRRSSSPAREAARVTVDPADTVPIVPASGEVRPTALPPAPGEHASGPEPVDSASVPSLGSLNTLSTRQREVLYMVVASSEVGPTAVATTLGIPLTTAYRDLALLERLQLVERTEDGKRVPTKVLLASSSVWRNL